MPRIYLINCIKQDYFKDLGAKLILPSPLMRSIIHTTDKIMTAITVNFDSIISFSDEQFLKLCQKNPDTRFERNAKGEIIIMPPTGGETGKNNTELIGQFWLWNRTKKLGVVFDSSTGYKLENTAIRSPDVSWLKIERWQLLTAQQRKKYLPIAPDFVLELISPSDNLKETRAKMQEYIDNGVRLGWLINPETQQIEIYKSGKEVEILKAPQTLSEPEILPDFILNLQTIWSDN